MSDMYAHVSVRILEKEYQVACPANERTDLLKVVGLDRIAVMAALNMANELLRTRAKDEELETSLGPRLRVLNERVDTILGGTQELEL
jgi:cell division protein ZapA